MSEPLVVIGNGMAAARFADELCARALGRYAVAVVGEEPRLAYNRVLLSSVLAGEVASSEIELKPRAGGAIAASRCATAAARPRSIRRRAPSRSPTGSRWHSPSSCSRPARSRSGPRSPAWTLPGVITFRDINDIWTIWHRAGSGDRVVVIGGGLLGLEAAYGLAKAGARVTVLHLMDRLMERQLDRAGRARCCSARSRRMGIEVVLNADTAEIAGDSRVEGVTLKDGRTIEADAVVVAIGIRPSADLARDAGIAVKRGIVVDDALETNIAGIHAIGECAEHRGICYGLVEPAHEQARVLARSPRGARRALCRQRARHQSEGLRRQRVLGRRFPRQRRHRGDRPHRSRHRPLQEARRRGRPPRRRGAVRRYRGRALVSRPDPLRREHREHPRRSRLRPRARRTRCSPPRELAA